MSWLEQKEELEKIAKSIDPSAKLLPKIGWFPVLLSYLKFGFTKDSREYFMLHYATTVGSRIYIPVDWDYYQVLRVIYHEARHVRQFRWCGFNIHPDIGIPIFGILYVFIPLPVLFAFFRMWFELDAERPMWKWMLENGITEETIYWRAQNSAINITGPDYVFAWIRPWAKSIFKNAAKKVIEEYNGNHQ